MCGDLKEMEKFGTQSQQRNIGGGVVNSVSMAAVGQPEFAV